MIVYLKCSMIFQIVARGLQAHLVKPNYLAIFLPLDHPESPSNYRDPKKLFNYHASPLRATISLPSTRVAFLTEPPHRWHAYLVLLSCRVDSSAFRACVRAPGLAETGSVSFTCLSLSYSSAELIKPDTHRYSNHPV